MKLTMFTAVLFLIRHCNELTMRYGAHSVHYCDQIHDIVCVEVWSSQCSML